VRLVACRAVVLTFLLSSLTITSIGSAQAFRLEIVSVTSTGAQGAGSSERPCVSADGRFVAFRSSSALVPGTFDYYGYVYVHDRQTRQTRLASVSSEGAPVSKVTYLSMSANGRFVAFDSYEADVVPEDSNDARDVFVHDLHTRQTTRASVQSGGGEADGWSQWPSISADGRFVAFESGASNLVPDDTNGCWDIFVHDRQTTKTTRVSVASTGDQADRGSGYPSISRDGRVVAFSSFAHNLVPGPFQGALFVHDRQAGTTEPVGFAVDGSPANYAQRPSLNENGQRVAFYAGEVVDPPPSDGALDEVLVYDRRARQTIRTNVSSAGVPGNRGAYAGDWPAAISGDGRYVAFESCASNLVPDDTGEKSDVFRHDSATGETVRLSEGMHGGGDEHSWGGASVSADGQVVAFASRAENIVPGDSNGSSDIFVADFAAPPQAPPFLYWADTAGYDSDGVEPDRGHAGGEFEFAVRLTDPDGDEPAFVRLLLLRDGEAYRTFDMEPGAGSTQQGRVYSFTRSLPAAIYSYRFAARDEDGEATGTPTLEKRGPLIIAPPHLEWVGEPGYESDGVDPDQDTPPRGRFCFRMRLVDLDEDLPEFVRVVLTKDGSHYRNYRMWREPVHSPRGHLYTSWEVYLQPGNYTYRFEAEDDDGSATGEPTAERIGPIIPSPPYLTWQGGAGYEADGVSPDAGTAGVTRFRFKVRYHCHHGEQPRYVRVILKRNGAFYRALRMRPLRGTDPVTGIVYVAARRLPVGSYSHRFRAVNSEGVARGPARALRPGPVVAAGGALMVTGLAAVPTGGGGVQVTFALSDPATVSADVLNVVGRVVGTISRGRDLDAGVRTLVWSGRTATGVCAPSGTYVIRLRCRGAGGTESCHLATVPIRR
jgi:Tol biopolymer transport system component